jgi:hypothetical protein
MTKSIKPDKKINMKPFCCERFSNSHGDGIQKSEEQNGRSVYPFILILKLKSGRIFYPKTEYRFYLVCGLIKDKPPFVNMAFCPFCGQNLFAFYKDDAFINRNIEEFER